MAKSSKNAAQQIVDYTELLPTDTASIETLTTETTSEVIEATVEEVVKTPTQEMEELDTKHGKVKSKIIRELHANGMATKDIVKRMQLIYPRFIYQHARNVLNQPLKKGG